MYYTEQNLSGMLWNRITITLLCFVSPVLFSQRALAGCFLSSTACWPWWGLRKMTTARSSGCLRMWCSWGPMTSQTSADSLRWVLVGVCPPCQCLFYLEAIDCYQLHVFIIIFGLPFSSVTPFLLTRWKSVRRTELAISGETSLACTGRYQYHNHIF